MAPVTETVLQQQKQSRVLNGLKEQQRLQEAPITVLRRTERLNEGARAVEETSKSVLKEQVKQTVKDGVLAFAWFTATLTPYMIFVVGLNTNQYVSWVVGVQAILVPPLGAIYSRIARKIGEKKVPSAERK